MIKKIGIFCNDNSHSEKIFRELIIKLKKIGYIIDNNDFDLALAIGGDGAFLRMVRNCDFNSKVYYLGINTGTLGFSNEIYPSEIDNFLLMLQEDNYQVEEVSVGETSVFGKYNNFKLNFLNEILIRNANLKTVHLDVKVNSELLEKTMFL